MKYDICVFGGTGWDRMFYQREDGTYLENPDIETLGSKGTNQAVAAYRAGAKIVLIGTVGNDEIGKKIIFNLKQKGIDTSCVEVIENSISDFCNIYVAKEDKDYKADRFRGAIDHFSEEMVEKYAEVIKNSKVVIMQYKINKKVSARLIQFCHENGVEIVMTPCNPDKINVSIPEDLELLKKIKFITANKKEALMVTNASSISEAINILPNLIVTSGEQGVFYMGSTGTICNVPSLKPTSLVDTTGAGDTFNGNFTASYIQNPHKEMEYWVKRGIAASTLKIAEKGAQPGMPYKNKTNKRLLKAKFFNEFNKAKK